MPYREREHEDAPPKRLDVLRALRLLRLRTETLKTSEIRPEVSETVCGYRASVSTVRSELKPQL